MPEQVRAKFYCQSITQRKNYDATKPYLWDYEFSPVTSGSEENKKFFAYTPSGTIKLTSINEQLFKIGQEYYLDFTPAAE